MVEVFLDTQQPYQHCLEVPDDLDDNTTVTVDVLNFRHHSKSVANNYCMFAQVSALTADETVLLVSDYITVRGVC